MRYKIQNRGRENLFRLLTMREEETGWKRMSSHMQEAGVLEGAHSAVADLCPDCEKEALTEPVPVEPDE